jgi:protein-disulfide isomerase
VFGVIFFAAMIALAFAARPKLRLGLALFGAAFALMLVGVQAFELHAWCKLCMISDSSATLLALAILAGADPIKLTARRALLGGALVVALPIGFAIATAPSAEPQVIAASSNLPDVIARAQQPGKVTIVEFLDFECPFCRRFAPVLAEAVDHATQPVAIVRKMTPLTMHPHARTAALAWCCADAQGKGDAMAEALFQSPPDELTPEGCEKLAVSVGCDVDRYREALADPATSARVDADTADAQAAGATSLPTVFIGDQKFAGANHTALDLIAAIDHAH